MLTVKVRRSRDVSYLTHDQGRELEGLRDGPALRWLRGGRLNLPADAPHLLTTSERSAVVGYDLIVAAPRPVSVLVALDLEHAAAVVDAHQRAVGDALDYLEDRALVVRDRRGGDDRDLPGRWSDVAAFTHGVNRHGEPHLHDHVLVGARPQGASNVLDSRALFAHVLAADALYRSSLRAEVARTTPYRPWRSFDGAEHVAELDEGYRVLWGGHHADRGLKHQWSREEARDAWEADLARFEPHGSVRAPDRDPGRLDEHAFASTLDGRDTVARRHLVQAWANAAHFGRPAREVTGAVDLLFPDLSASRGVREESVSVREARMYSLTREVGARPLEVAELERWRQRSRERSREGWARER